MKAVLYDKLGMAVRVRDFGLANPPPDPSNAAVFARFGELLSRANTLAAQEQDGRSGARAATRRRAALRAEVHGTFLPQLIRVGALAAEEEPDLGGRFRFPKSSSRHAAFLTAVRSMLEVAREHVEVLAKHGLSADFLEELKAVFGQLESVNASANAHRRAHVGARADLEDTVGEIMKLVGVLDGMSRYRFRADPEKTAAWQSARNVAGPSRGKPAGPPAEGDAKAA